MSTITDDTATITDDLASLLAKARRPGDFHVSGVVETFPPGLSVEGVGEIALPLLPFQAEQLVAAASAAPFGRGAETVYDPNVRRTWQIEPGQVKIASKHWPQTLQTVLARVGEGLGVEDPIEAEFYKLLVYDEGSFFAGHRDTEKSPGMFATLVIVLPSVCSGGELVVRHGGREAKLDMRAADPSEIAFAAFYADCVHEVLPVTSGCRLALVYNLTRRGKRGALAPPSHEREQAAAAALLGEWAGRGDPPTKIVYLLEHAYTQAELGFAALKGADSAAAAILVEAARRARCDLHLALLTIEESGAAEYADSPRSRRDRWSEPELEAGEVFESSRVLSQWRRPDGAASPLSELPFGDDEISPSEALEDMVPDEEHFQEHAGNEGASFERSYSRAALVLWPSDRIFAVVNQAGLAATLPLLADMAMRWTASGEDRGSQLWRDARALSEEMLRTWPTGGSLLPRGRKTQRRGEVSRRADRPQGRIAHLGIPDAGRRGRTLHDRRQRVGRRGAAGAAAGAGRRFAAAHRRRHVRGRVRTQRRSARSGRGGARAGKPGAAPRGGQSARRRHAREGARAHGRQ